MKNKILVLTVLLFLLGFPSFAQDGKYERQNIWDKGINEMLETDTRQTPPKDAVLFVGSSSLVMWKTLNKDFPNLKFINRAFGGSEFEDLNYYAPRIVIPYKPKKIFVYEGDNDINSGKTAERVLEDFKKFIEIVRRDLPKTKIYFISIKPSIARWNLWNEMQKANRLIENETKRMKRTEFVDVASAMLDENGRPREDIFLQDKLHMNANGYAIWRRVLAEYVK